MGHQSNDARKALRAYARDLQSAAGSRAVVSSVGTSKQDDASTQFSGSGAPHQLAIAAVVVCVVLLGGIGFASATNTTPTAKGRHAVSVSARSASVVAAFARTGTVSTTQAVRAFNDLGMARSASALDVAAGTGIDSSPEVQQALMYLIAAVHEKLTSNGYVSEFDFDIGAAVYSLETAVVRPPGLSADWVPPGLGGTPPGQDEFWTPPGQNDDFQAPGQDPGFAPPGQEDEGPSNSASDKATGGGKGTAPGLSKDKPGTGGGSP